MKAKNEHSTFEVVSILIRALVSALIAVVGFFWTVVEWILNDFGSAASIGVVAFVIYAVITPEWIAKRGVVNTLAQAIEELGRRAEAKNR